MRILGIDYGDSRTGFAITDGLNITVQGLETLNSNGNDKLILKKIDEYLEIYDIGTIVLGMPFGLDGNKTERTEKTEQFMHKLKCKYNKLNIDYMDERLTTVAAHRTMNFLDINKHKKKNIVDTISAVYILETYVNRLKNSKN